MIGIFGGTFNPIHFGHLNLAIELKEKCALDEVWLIPSHLNPLRNEIPIAKEHRQKMCELAIRDIPGFFLKDVELKRPPPSYTVDTLQSLYDPKKKFTLLLGEDSALQFNQWKDPHKIIELATLKIGCRGEFAFLKKVFDIPMDSAIMLSIERGVVKTSNFDVSATQVRERLRENKFCGHLVPRDALDYIYANQLYYNA